METMRRAAVALLAALLAPPPDARAVDVPKGEVAKYEFKDSKVFPGTVRDYWVYVQKQYDPAKPACLYVNQDGVQYNAPDVFDELIADGEMPVTNGVFVMPGRVPAGADDALPRFNRSFEYDGLGDNYARFLVEELLPDVESRTTSDGRPIRLSADPNDRAIGGASSGAICAFTVAWERPDGFRRVFSAVGTYVGLRGGNDYPTLIRKTEPKPIRVFLEDGENDLNIYGGDWWMANQEMERALRFAGYEVEHNWGKGGHDAEHATAIFPDAMRWLWKGYPEPVRAGQGSPQLQQILLPGEGWQLVADGYRFTEGPVADADGTVFFNDVPASKTYEVRPDGQVRVALEDSRGGNGQSFGADGTRYVAAADGVLAYKEGAGAPEPLATGFRANDVIAKYQGPVYATNPSREPGVPSLVLGIDPDGKKTLIDDALKFPNGITLSPDQTQLYVAESRSKWIWAYHVDPDGTVSAGQRYGHLHVPDTADDAGADGLRCDRDGRLWVATRMGLQVLDPIGRVNCIIPAPDGRVSNLTFGGPDHDVLYATCGDKVFRRKLKVKGALNFEPPVKQPTPGL
jgi:sugar lactone lactonase YvrE/enterochelin esterase-like enzyme